MTIKVVAIVQARMSSQRLPGKSLCLLSGKPSLQWILERVRTSKSLDALAVATTDRPTDAPIEELCSELEIPCYRGSEDDVLQRIWDAASNLGADVLVRLTGDNPFVNHELVDGAVERFLNATQPVSYLNSAASAGWPTGLMVEVVTMTALKEALNSSSPEDREHVTWYVKQRPQIFSQEQWRSPYAFPECSLTVDTAADYDRVAALYSHLTEISPCFGLEDLARALSSREFTGSV